MTNPRHALGVKAEQAVARWLTACGWRVVARRHRSAEGGEVDLVVLDPSGCLVGVEVRARRTPRTGAPIETIDARRIRRIARTLAAVARSRTVAHEGVRVDLVTAEPVSGDPARWRLRRTASLSDRP